MTHSLTTVAEALLHPDHLYSVTELRAAPTLIPRSGGIYAWWFLNGPPGVPLDGTTIHAGRRLLYVGIAPRKPSAVGRPSTRTLRTRLLNHCRGPLASSTLRRTLSVLLQAELELCLAVTNAGKLKMSSDNESRLTQWMDENAQVFWIVHPEPWEVEDYLLKSTVRLPLNIRGSSDPFVKRLSTMRSQVCNPRK
jgi:hypothetical protein